MKKIAMFSFTLIFAISMAIVAASGAFTTNRAYAATAGETPLFTETKILKATGGDHMLLATGISNYDDVYEVGYTITKNGEAYVPSAGEFSGTGSYYTSISTQNSLGETTVHTAATIFGEEYDSYGIIIWEINYSYNSSYSYQAYAMVGERDGDNLVLPEEEVKAQATLRETPVTYTVSFDSNGGTSVAEQYVESGSNAVSPANVPEKQGYTFAKWQKNGVDFDFNTAITETITLTAVYTANTDTPYKAEAYIMNDNGTYPMEATETVNKTGTTATTAEINENWFNNGNGVPEGFTVDTDNANNVLSGTIAADGSLVLKVYIKIITYSVTFNTDGGSEVSEQTIRYGNTASMPTNPVKSGYRFDGWFVGNNAFDFSTVISQDTVITARYTSYTDVANGDCRIFGDVGINNDYIVKTTNDSYTANVNISIINEDDKVAGQGDYVYAGEFGKLAKFVVTQNSSSAMGGNWGIDVKFSEVLSVLNATGKDTVTFYVYNNNQTKKWLHFGAAWKTHYGNYESGWLKFTFTKDQISQIITDGGRICSDNGTPAEFWISDFFIGDGNNDATRVYGDKNLSCGIFTVQQLDHLKASVASSLITENSDIQGSNGYEYDGGYGNLWKVTITKNDVTNGSNWSLLFDFDKVLSAMGDTDTVTLHVYFKENTWLFFGKTWASGYYGKYVPGWQTFTFNKEQVQTIITNGSRILSDDNGFTGGLTTLEFWFSDFFINAGE